MSVSALTLALMLLSLTMPAQWTAHGQNQYSHLYGANTGFSNSFTSSSFFYMLFLERRVADLEEQLNEAMSQLSSLEGFVTDMARQECQTDTIVIQNCPSIGDNPNDVTNCVTASSPVSQDFVVSFSPAFTKTPIVDISMSGGSTFTGVNFTTTITAVSDTSFSFNYLADDFLPVASELTWYACPAALLGPNEELPEVAGANAGPLGTVVGHGTLSK